MVDLPPSQYPVFVICGRGLKRRRLLKVLDPEGTYKSKSLLPFVGKRLIDWQLEELHQSPYVEALYLIGLAAEDAVFVPEDYERLEQFVKMTKCVDLRT